MSGERNSYSSEDLSVTSSFVCGQQQSLRVWRDNKVLADRVIASWRLASCVPVSRLLGSHRDSNLKRLLLLCALFFYQTSGLQEVMAENKTVTNSTQGSTGSPQVLDLWPGTAPGSEGIQIEEERERREQGEYFDIWIKQVSKPTLAVYLPPEKRRSGTGVVICPGGGYGGLSLHKEGHALAQWFVEQGVVAGVLKYRHAPFKQPIPLLDAQRAMRIFHSHAEQWNLNPQQIGIVGFSAGGHLASTAGTQYDEGNPEAEDPVSQASCHAHFMVLVYPVISMDQSITHSGSRKNLLGKDPSPELVQKHSNENRVTHQTGPAFLVHASNDLGVPVANSLRFYEALIKQGVEAELHIYDRGGHGFGFFRGDRPVDNWPLQLKGWLKQRDLLE